MYGLVDEHRAAHGVEPICAVLQIAPSAYRRHAARRRGQATLSVRTRRDVALMPVIEQVWNTNLRVYGADKVWKQMNREGVAVARCTVERLMGVRLISVQKVTVHARPQSEHWRGVRSAPLRKCLSGNEFLLVLQSAVERLFVGAISAGGACFRRGL